VWRLKLFQHAVLRFTRPSTSKIFLKKIFANYQKRKKVRFGILNLVEIFISDFEKYYWDKTRSEYFIDRHRDTFEVTGPKILKNKIQEMKLNKLNI
jgi:hypothetical protein